MFKIEEPKPGVFRLSLGDFPSREQAMIVACELAASTYPSDHRERLGILKYKKELEGIANKKEAENSRTKLKYDRMMTR
jgi:hypothetical protein